MFIVEVNRMPTGTPGLIHINVFVFDFLIDEFVLCLVQSIYDSTALIQEHECLIHNAKSIGNIGDMTTDSREIGYEVKVDRRGGN